MCKEVKTVPLCPAAALRRLAMGVVIVGDGILKRIQIKFSATVYKEAMPSRRGTSNLEGHFLKREM